jgi:arylsulfatase A-like enzyme
MALRTKPLLFAAFLAALLVPAAQAGAETAPRRPSVVMVILDSVRADRTSPYGYVDSATPALSGLAEHAVVFENAYSNSNWTGAAIASILTGRRPFSHGLVGLFDHLPEGTTTLQSVLSRGGYETAASFSGLPAEPKYGLVSGFGRLLVPKNPFLMSSQVEAALEWEKGLPPEKDFFMLIHSDDTHWPYHCRPRPGSPAVELPKVDEEFISYYDDGFPAWDFNKLSPEKWRRALDYRKDPGFLPALSEAYDLCVSQADGALAELLDGLAAQKERPLLVIVTADHGELLGDHGLIGHGRNFFEPLSRVPLVIAFPGMKGALRRAALAEHVDLLPTVCGAAGLRCPAGLDGKKLAPAPDDAGAREKWAAAAGGSRTVITSAFMDGRKKLMRVNMNWKLFDLAADPGEESDISEKEPAEFLRMAEGYLAVSGAKDLVRAVPAPAGDITGCLKPPVSRDYPPGASQCERARVDALVQARERNFAAAAATLEGSGCPPATIAADTDSLKLVEQVIVSSPRHFYQSYKFSAAPGLWKVEKDGISVSYDPENGLECRGPGDRPLVAKECVVPAAALLICVDEHRFPDKRADAARGHYIEDALRKAGYIQ